MEQVNQKDPEELYQEELKEEQELLGYCKKIKQGIENLDENSGERAIWELIQNARDVAENDNCIIKIILKDGKLVFAHRGIPFEFQSLLALVNQNSSKDNPNADLAGQYGTGFMTTHAFCNIVSIDAPYKVMVSKEVLKGYVLLEDFTLNRSFVDSVNEDMKEAKMEMKKEIEAVNKAYKRTPIYPSLDSLEEENRWTKFTYNLNGRNSEASGQLARAIRLMPLVLLINKRIKEVEIIDDYAHLHQKVTKITSPSVKKLDDIEGWQLSSYQIIIEDLVEHSNVPMIINCLESEDCKDKILLPPYPTSCGFVENIPSLFLWFPLLGTEKFGVNFIFHSKRFYPVEKRNNILLPVDVPSKLEKGQRNEALLKDMMDALLKFYANDDNAASLDISMCQVNFNQEAEDLVTRQFYIDLQNLWKGAIQNWKVIPTAEGKKAITDPKVKVLHPAFYSVLKDDERKEYEPLLKAFASKVMYDENKSYLLPSEDLIKWSETISKWKCENDNEFYITVEDVCKTIKENSEDLMAFLKFLKDSGNLSLVSQHPLIPNREGELKKKGDLRHGDFMTNEVYSLVKVVMGEDASRMINTECLKIIEEVSEYTPKNLHDAITSTMHRWRSLYMNPNSHALDDEQLTALINFCSATSQTEFTNIRGRLMNLIPALYGKAFEQRFLKKLEEKEDDFYSAAFNLMRDYSLMTLSLKDKEWVKKNKQWVVDFLKEYSTIKDKDFVEKLDTYGVIPNWHDVLCLKKDLYKNDGVPDELVKYYKAIFNEDLLDDWIDQELAPFFELAVQTPKDIASKIQEILEDDMSEKGEKKYTKILREVILKLGERNEWKDWFGHVEEKKATYTFNMKSGDAQKSLFALMDLDDKELQDLANISAEGKMADLIDKIQKQIEQEQVTAARFAHLQTIGEHVEEALLKAIDSDVVQVVYPKNKDEYVDAANRQNGQDIVVSVKKHNQTIEEIYYIEVKSKWDFNEAAHMSTNQVKKACQNSDKYCLCCVDLRKYREDVLEDLSQQVILDCTNVKMDIGEMLKPLMNEIIEADNRSDDVQIKISDYRSNMGAPFFEKGEPFQKLLDTLVKKVQDSLQS